MARKKKDGDTVDRKSAGAGEGMDPMSASADQHAGDGESIFDDGPLDDAAAIAELIELNHQRQECSQRWEDAKAEAAEAKKELDNASNAISLLIDRIDRQRSGGAEQPALKAVN
jgi:hypothetical protein